MKKRVTIIIITIIILSLSLGFRLRAILPQNADIYTVWLYDSLNSKEIELSEEEKTAILDSIKTSKMRLSLGYKNAVPDYILIIGYHKGHYSYNLNLQILHDTSYVKINDKIFHMRIINNDLYNILTDQVL